MNVFIQQTLELIFIPPRIALLSLNNEGGILSNPVTQGFVDSKEGLNVDQLDEQAMLIESVQLPNPVGELRILLF